MIIVRKGKGFSASIANMHNQQNEGGETKFNFNRSIYAKNLRWLFLYLIQPKPSLDSRSDCGSTQLGVEETPLELFFLINKTETKKDVKSKIFSLELGRVYWSSMVYSMVNSYKLKRWYALMFIRRSINGIKAL